MADKIDIAAGLRVPRQVPLDVKAYPLSEALLMNLGPANNLAYTYFDGLIAFCNQEETYWKWRENVNDEEGLMPLDFVYPAGWTAFGINYGLKSFNFFRVYSNFETDIDNRIFVLEENALADAVLKYGEIVITGNLASIIEDDFQWRLNKVSHLETPAYSTTINYAADGFYRSDLVVGDTTGNYSIIEGVEDDTAAPEPAVPPGYIKLALIPIFGAVIGVPPILPNYDDKYLKRYKSTYKTSQPIFYLSPGEDDYNVIFIGAGSNQVRVELNGTNGKYIKNGAIYPFKNMTSGVVTVTFNVGVTLNAPNGVVLTPNQQCYVIKDDYNQWTVIIPIDKSEILPSAFGTFKWILRGTDHANAFPIAGDMFEGYISPTEFSSTIIWNGIGALDNTNLANFSILNSTQI